MNVGRIAPGCYSITFILSEFNANIPLSFRHIPPKIIQALFLKAWLAPKENLSLGRMKVLSTTLYEEWKYYNEPQWLVLYSNLKKSQRLKCTLVNGVVVTACSNYLQTFNMTAATTCVVRKVFNRLKLGEKSIQMISKGKKTHTI